MSRFTAEALLVLSQASKSAKTLVSHDALAADCSLLCTSGHVRQGAGTGFLISLKPNGVAVQDTAQYTRDDDQRVSDAVCCCNVIFVRPCENACCLLVALCSHVFDACLLPCACYSHVRHPSVRVVTPPLQARPGRTDLTYHSCSSGSRETLNIFLRAISRAR